MPVLFVGHGSPMNIIEDNQYTQNMRLLAQSMPAPKSILCISAHWITEGTQVLSSERPRQIFDFYGFPPELYKIKYEPNGSPRTAEQIEQKLPSDISQSTTWGLDHGTWSVLKHMYPQADVPTFQLSIDQNKSIEQHFEIARQLAHLREEGVLLMGSGNLVHNLRVIDWNPDAKVKQWATDFESQALSIILGPSGSKLEKIEKVFSLSTLAKAHPTVDHLLPLVYTMGGGSEDSKIEIPYFGFQNASISMTSIKSEN